MCYIFCRGKTKAFILLLQSFSKSMFLAGLEPATFRVLGGCDNHYTTETTLVQLALTWHRLSLSLEPNLIWPVEYRYQS